MLRRLAGELGQDGPLVIAVNPVPWDAVVERIATVIETTGTGEA